MKTVIVTGASRGIGLATVKKFLAEGWFTIGTSTKGKVDINDKNFVSLALAYPDEKSIDAAIKNIAKIGRKIDVLVNNAAIALDDIGNDLDTDKLRETLEVNVISTADFTIKLLPFLNVPSHIINISSMAASLGDPIENTWHTPAYKISKTALNMFTRTMARQLQPKNIIVSSLDPGWVKTDMGGPEGERIPEEAADDIYKLAISKVETGKFWLEGKERGW